MAEAPEAEPVPTTSESLRGPEPAADCASEASSAAANRDEDEPIAKRTKLGEGLSDRLEFRLGGILCCAVCLDLPPAAVYQCCNGHLMCAPCFTHLLADARLRDESHATCPNCRVEISKTTASRNLAVEKTVSELPSECKYCLQVFPRHSLHHHEESACEERLMGCRYAVIGCPWRGPAHEACGHEQACLHPCKSAAEVVTALQEREKAAAESAALYTQMLDLLSYEKITFNDLQLKPYRTEEFMTKLYYESSRFSAFGQQWVVKAFVNRNQRDPTQCSQREITYQFMIQLILKSKPLGPVAVQWVVVRGPHGEARLHPAPRSYVYREEAAAAPPLPLPLTDPADANRLLANKAIHFRLIMFQACK